MPPVFGWLKRTGAIAQGEMPATFNCGIGMVAVMAESQADDVMLTLAGEGEAVTRLGAIVERPAGTQVVYRGKLKFTCWLKHDEFRSVLGGDAIQWHPALSAGALPS